MVPRRKITRDLINQAVIDIGFDSATTTTVAKFLGLEQSSIYRHIGSKEDMITGAINQVIIQRDWTFIESDWRSGLRSFADNCWTLLREHPGLAAQLYQLSAVPTQMAFIMAVSVDSLTSQGWKPADAIILLDTIADMAGDSAKRLDAAKDSLSESGKRAQAYYDDLAAKESAPQAQQLHQLGNTLTEMLDDDPQRWWNRRIDFLIAGAEKIFAENQTH